MSKKINGMIEDCNYCGESYEVNNEEPWTCDGFCSEECQGEFEGDD